MKTGLHKTAKLRTEVSCFDEARMRRRKKNDLISSPQLFSKLNEIMRKRP